MLNMELNLLKDMYSAHNSTEAKPTTTSFPVPTPTTSSSGNPTGAFGMSGNSSGTVGMSGNSCGTFGTLNGGPSSGNSQNVVVEQLYTAEPLEWNKSGWNS